MSFSAFKMNTNGAAGTSNVGPFCYDYNATMSDLISNDYLEILQGYTFSGGTISRSIPANKFCGIFDGTSFTFPGITCTTSTTFIRKSAFLKRLLNFEPKMSRICNLDLFFQLLSPVQLWSTSEQMMASGAEAPGLQQIPYKLPI